MKDKHISNGEKRDYNGLFDAVFPAMLEKLKENEHKCGWDNIEPEYALGRIFDEYLELKDAIPKGDMEEIRREAADVANFAAMIIYQCDKELEEVSHADITG